LSTVLSKPVQERTLRLPTRVRRFASRHHIHVAYLADSAGRRYEVRDPKTGATVERTRRAHPKPADALAMCHRYLLARRHWVIYQLNPFTWDWKAHRPTLDGKPFTDMQGLGQALHDHPALPGCLINRIYSYGIGGATSPGADKAELQYLKARFERSGYKLPDLLRDIALSNAFSSVRPAAAGKAKPAATTVVKDGTGAEPAKIALNQN